MLEALAPIATRFFLAPVNNPRGENPENIHLPDGIPGAVFPGVQAAVEAAGKLPERILVTGSLFFVGEVYLAGAGIRPIRSQRPIGR